MTAVAPAAYTTARRMYLLATLQNLYRRITTRQALQIYAKSPWHTVSKGTARRDLRDLARRGYLIPDDTNGPRGYTISNPPPSAHPFHGRSMRNELLDAIRREGGEWTAGRTKAICRRTIGTHVYRATGRRHLADLHRLGHLDRHGDDTPRRYYTLRPERAAA